MNFEDFYLSHENRVLGLLHMKVNHDDVEDVAAEVWLRVYQHFDSIRKPTQYLNKTVASQVSSYYRRLEVQMRHDVALAEDTDLVTERDDTHNRAVVNLSLDAAKAVITQMTPRHRAALESSGVRQRVAVHRARVMLREQVSI